MGGKGSLLLLVKISLTFFAMIFLSSYASAQQGDIEAGKKIYEIKCVRCHGWEGMGDGAASEFLNPPPRDFTMGLYKFKTSTFEEYFPNDKDIFRAIKEGLPGTSMPRWDDVLKDQDMWDLVAYVKNFVEGWEAPANSVDLGGKIGPSGEVIEKGAKLFKDRCSECHGDTGKGTGIKILRDDWGFRTWPRNLTKSWTFRFSNKPEDIYARIATGIPGTQMPSFNDPANKNSMTDEERWQVANYVASIGDDSKKIKDGETVIKTRVVDGALPDTVDDPVWSETEVINLTLVPQIIAKDRFFTPTNDSISVRALYNDEEIAFLLEWDDRTESIPGDEKAQELVDEELFEDAVAIQFPAKKLAGMEMPYFGHGDSSHPVNIWLWKSGTRDETPQSFNVIDATGLKGKKTRESQDALKGKSNYNDGTWRVLIKRPLTTDEENDIQFEVGKFTPIGFANWDGSNGEVGSKHTLSTWYWVLLEQPIGMNVYAIPLISILIIVGLQFYLAKTYRKDYTS